MANVKITDLTAADDVDGVDLFEITKDPAGTPLTRRATAGQVLRYVRDSLVLLSTAALASVTGMADGDVIRVVSPRDGGFWRFNSGNMSAFVTADPHGGLWRAPTAASTGASGAWQRMVEKDAFDTEWWLPDAMPSNAQVRLNSIFDGLPTTARTLILPRREVTVTGTWILDRGITYEGAGRACAFNGGGGSGFFPITIAASNAKLYNISSGNVTGTATQGEPGGFHITDGLALYGSDGGTIENVSVRDCHAFTARTGIRVGYKTTGNVDATVVFGSRDTFIENFQCNGIGRIGIECMRSHGVQIVGGTIRMAEDTFSAGGLKRCVRLAGASVVSLQGVRLIGANAGDSDNLGVAVELAQNGSSLGSCTTIVCESVITENCVWNYDVDRSAQNVLISGCKAVGRSNDRVSYFLRTVTSMVSGEEIKNLSLKGNQAYNLSVFIRIQGRVVGLTADSNEFISNNGSSTRFLETDGSAANTELIEARFVSNRAITNASDSSGPFRYAGMSASASITVDDNEITGGSAGNIFTFTGDGTIRMRRRDSNRTLPSTLWAAVRPSLALEVYV